MDRFSFEKEVQKKRDIPVVMHSIWEDLFDNKISPLSVTDQQITLNGTPLNLLKQETDGGCWKTASWDILRKAVEDGVIEIGAHGQTHTPFNWLTEEQLAEELIENKARIIEKLQIPVTACSFPHGLYNDRTITEMEKYFKYGFTNKSINALGDNERMIISRYNVPFQRPNSILSLIKYPFAGKVLRKLGSLTGLY